MSDKPVTIDEQIAFVRDWIELQIHNENPVARIGVALAIIASLQELSRLRRPNLKRIIEAHSMLTLATAIQTTECNTPHAWPHRPYRQREDEGCYFCALLSYIADRDAEIERLRKSLDSRKGNP